MLSPISFLKRLRQPSYPTSLLATTFNYVLLDDIPFPDTPLPKDTLPQCTPEEVEQAYRLCWQILERGVNRSKFRHLIMHIARTGSASKDEQLEFKHARAKFKHMRFACANFSKRHRYPLLLHIITIIMGNMQDAFKNHQRIATWINGIALYFMLLFPIYCFIQGSMLGARLDTPEGIRAYHMKQNDKLAHLMTSLDETTGHEFHVMRKLISRRVAFNDTLRTIRPSASLNQLSECLATINGMMGDMHDDLIEMKLKGTQNYHRDRFTPPHEIMDRIKAFLSRSGAL